MAKRFNKIYLEISNVCNLSCAFCPGTKRRPQIMETAEFAALLPRLRPWTDYLYFHLMGEPLCHPHLREYLHLAGEAGFKVIITTNGTLLADRQEMLLSMPGLHKVNISLHAFEANDLKMPFEAYLTGCFAFGKAAEGGLVFFTLCKAGNLFVDNTFGQFALLHLFDDGQGLGGNILGHKTSLLGNISLIIAKFFQRNNRKISKIRARQNCDNIMKLVS